jgi:sulfate adenylyltransferase subunit 2
MQPTLAIASTPPRLTPAALAAAPGAAAATAGNVVNGPAPRTHALKHLRELEAESIYIFREVVAEFERPVLLYSIGKDSSVLLHLARKAFAPGKIPFPLLHIASGWDFRELLEFRDRMAREIGFELIVHTNEAGAAAGVTPFTHGSSYADVMLTESLKQALAAGRFDAAFGGARRDEDKSRAKERVFSFRDRNQRWDPRNQRPELWQLYNGRVREGESIRAFPLSNWTEYDIWNYIQLENVPIVPLYLARRRPVVQRKGQKIVVDDARMPLEPGEVPREELVRFRTLGCYPLTAATASTATTVSDIIAEMQVSRTSERHGRLVDADQSASMERKKREGYF